ncbi:hypothetical protein POSPLADRAFT_1033910 [Postia placenta MAD-698-R-SB12]|uniref:Protein kinase domain-containing protein n=1 Tax=Postia placenta MAD-698-R-SB12 TaxID=670580 RepID=A0A1X6N0W2_9APHY|nr:hypothetical protein POSPLADRAFT_1033910 [Postia placenta MAD-698-R-SB12]OSX62265.1 hypothetical protein POSPLADRAFT_1033910 [Postia placenta MAD-698-R-SB12]
MSFPPFRICNFYQVSSMLGHGGFGAVHRGLNLLTGEWVAIKVEMPPEKEEQPAMLPYEAAIYKLLRGKQGIPCIRWSGMYGGAHVLAMDMLGSNLDQLRRVCRGQFTLRTVLILAEQMVGRHHPGKIYILDRVEFAHSRGIVLRDVKPDNFAMGHGHLANIVHLYDFGLSKLYRDPETGAHMAYREDRQRLGTIRYASLNMHLGRELSRRDDMESLGYSLIYLLNGRLPWQGIYAPDVEWKIRRIREMKAGKALEDLLASAPPEFGKYFEHCRGLRFEQKPDYAFLRTLFRKRMQSEGWQYDMMIPGIAAEGTHFSAVIWLYGIFMHILP